jgi:methionyl-tRNA formyltransferase
LRVVFAGTPPFAARALEDIKAAGHEIPLVLTQPDRPAGRGLRLSESAVSEAAARLAIPVGKFPSLKGPEALAALQAARPDVIVVAAYGLMLPRDVLSLPPRGCVNIHASLLPRWRGAAPIQRAILAGDEMTGITIMKMDEGLDTGPMLLRAELPISGIDTAASLASALAKLGGVAIVRALDALPSLEPLAQDASRATYARKIVKEEARIDWSLDCREIDRSVRAFNPAPGAETTLGAQKLKLWETRISDATGAPGAVLVCEGDRLLIACGKGALEILLLQRAGGRRMGARDFLAGGKIFPGMVFGAHPRENASA